MTRWNCLAKRTTRNLAVKSIQTTLMEDVETMCNHERPSAEDPDVNKWHGRIEVRLCHAFDPDAIIRMCHQDWMGLRSVVRVKATRSIGGKATGEERYYISSLLTSNSFNVCIRNHMGVENKLHLMLDMTFRENHQRKRSKMAAQNFSLVRKFARNFFKKDNSKLSLINKRLKAAWDWNYLMQLL